MNPGQIPALAITFVGAALDAVTAFAPTSLTPDEKTAILAAATAAIPLGLALYGWISHQSAMAARKITK